MTEQTEVFVEEWDKRKIAAGIFVLVIIIGGLISVKQLALPQLGILSPEASPKVTQEVAGAKTNIDTFSTSKKISLPTANDVNTKIQEIQNQVSNLTVADVASASPELQGIIQQIQALPQQPANIARQTCMDLCKKL